ncbi:hypothetical protein OA79_16855 [Marinomonas sp. TW1]|nr:hypothetical protein OA79_16855 [Marinomonas sp. TW1]
MVENCKYCLKEEAIENSHIIPSFVFEWIKMTSATKVMRSADNPNLRVQDGQKSALLCSVCEGKFAKVEELFKKEYFSKVANYRSLCPEELDITPSIIKCIYIIAWRSLADAVYFPRDHQYTDEEFLQFPSLLDEIKDAIETGSFSKFKTHVIPCTKEVLTKLGLPQVPWHHYERSVTAEPRIWDNWERFILYIQIPFSIIVFEIVPNEDDAWVGTQLEGRSKIKLSEIESVPSYLATQVEHFYQAFVDAKSKLSDTQLKKIQDDVSNAGPNNGSFKTMKKSW